MGTKVQHRASSCGNLLSPSSAYNRPFSLSWSFTGSLPGRQDRITNMSFSKRNARWTPESLHDTKSLGLFRMPFRCTGIGAWIRLILTSSQGRWILCPCHQNRQELCRRSPPRCRYVERLCEPLIPKDQHLAVQLLLSQKPSFQLSKHQSLLRWWAGEQRGLL